MTYGSDAPTSARVVPALIVLAVGLGVALAVLFFSGVRLGTGAGTPERSPADIIAVGDIAGCRYTEDEDTASLVDDMPGTILVLGDTAYPGGREQDFADCYAPTWGRHLERTRAVPGNHDYDTEGAEPFFAYFGKQAWPERGYGSFDLGAWHLIGLNSQCKDVPGGCDRESEQLSWLREDLSSTTATCALAFWHVPRFSSGEHGDDKVVAPFWELLDEAGADLVLAGHDHNYERFDPLDPDGAPSADGIRSFVVGTGGTPLREAGPARPGSAFIDDEHHGVLRLRLREASYEWSFVDTGGLVLDAGTGQCRA